jgi:hypothetical protein
LVLFWASKKEHTTAESNKKTNAAIANFFEASESCSSF